MRNIALKLMYNGTAYHGWQVQKNAVTVCETLQKALKQITGENSHHIIEAIFKAMARALAQAVSQDAARAGEIPSTKGVLL